jgi:hypothetical protein
METLITDRAQSTGERSSSLSSLAQIPMDEQC